MVILIIAGWWFAEASDTLKTIITKDEVKEIVKAEAVHRDVFKERVVEVSPYTPDKAKLDKVIEEVGEIKKKLNKIDDQNLELMKIMIQVKANQERQNGGK